MITKQNEVVWSDNEMFLRDRARLWSQQEVAWMWVHLCTAYLNGNIDESAWQKIQESFLFRDEEGDIWSLASADAQWFRLSEGDWIPGSPFGDLAAIAVFPTDSDMPNQQDEPSNVATSCTDCGCQIRPQDRFCPNCGRQILQPDTPNLSVQTFCQNCGQVLNGTEQFCANCGVQTEG